MKVPKNVTVIKDKTAEVAAAIRTLAKTRVMAGVPANKGTRSDPINNAALMYIHENGAPEANIPARPVIAPAIASITGTVEKNMERAGKLALRGDIPGMTKVYHSTGIVAQNALRKQITSGTFAPLAESTLAKRRAKGHSSVKPLIETGQLRRALTYVIRAVSWSGRLFGGK